MRSQRSGNDWDCRMTGVSVEAGVSPAHERYLQQAPAFAKELWRGRPPPPQGKAPNARVYPRVRLRLTIKTPNETQNFNRAVYGISPSYGEELTAYCCGSAERRPTNKFSRAHYGRARLRRAALAAQGELAVSLDPDSAACTGTSATAKLAIANCVDLSVCHRTWVK